MPNIYDYENPEAYTPPNSDEVRQADTPPQENERGGEEDKSSSRGRLIGSLATGAVIVGAGLALMSHNSETPKEHQGAVPIHIQKGDGSITGAIRRFYKETHPGQPVDEGYVATQAEMVKDRELNGSSLVHDGDVIYVDLPK